jgi:hypothetical protein
MSNEREPYGPNNPHPLSQLRTELVWEGKYDEYGHRRQVSLPTFPLAVQRIETIDEPRDRSKALCGQLLRQELGPHVPQSYDAQRTYFDPYIDNLPVRITNELRKHQRNLQRNLTHHAHSNRIGNLMFCLSLAADPAYATTTIGGVWEDVKTAFRKPNIQQLAPLLEEMNNFRNRRVVHVEDPITDLATAETNLVVWVKGLAALCGAMG